MDVDWVGALRADDTYREAHSVNVRIPSDQIPAWRAAAIQVGHERGWRVRTFKAAVGEHFGWVGAHDIRLDTETPTEVLGAEVAHRLEREMLDKIGAALDRATRSL